MIAKHKKVLVVAAVGLALGLAVALQVVSYTATKPLDPSPVESAMNERDPNPVKPRVVLSSRKSIGGPSVDPALLGVASPAPTSALVIQPPLRPEDLIADPRILRVYKSLEMAAEKAATRVTNPRTRLTADRLRALAKLTRVQRFYHAGDPRLAPANSHDFKYTSLNSDGYCIIWQLSRWEFPELFGPDDNPGAFTVPPHPRPPQVERR